MRNVSSRYRRKSKLPDTSPPKSSNLWKRICRHKWCYALMLPGVVWLFIFHLLPLWGIVISFQDFNPFLGILESEWVGLEHYKAMFGSKTFWQLVGNTLFISSQKMVVSFIAPIVLALTINEVKNKHFKKFVQTATYLPSFLSWVIIVGICSTLFNDYYGVFKTLFDSLGLNYTDITKNPDWFVTFLVISSVWRSVGVQSVIYLAALSGLDQEMYEAAKVDGVNKWQEITRITLPSILPVAATVLILSVGSLLSGDFEQIYLFAGDNARLNEVSDVIETFVFRNGIRTASFSFPAAVGMFQSIFGCCMVLLTNKITKKMGQRGVW